MLKLLAATLALVAAMPIVAADAEARENYGSIAYSPSTKATGYVWDRRSKQAAINDALEACFEYADDCVTAINYWNGACGAVAYGDRGWAGGSGGDGEEAQADALYNCEERTQNCRVRRWQCTDPAG